MGGGPGGAGLTPGSPDGAAEDARNAAPTDRTGLNSSSAGDHRIEANNQVCQAEGDWWLEVKGGKGENKIGGFLEFVVGLKHSMTGGFKTGVYVGSVKTLNYGPYATEMFAAKYEILANKDVKVMGKKSDTYTGFKFEKNNGPWTETTAAKRKKIQALEKSMNDAMTQRVGALLETTAAKYQAEARDAREKINELSTKVATKLRVKCEQARMSARQVDRNITDIKVQCDKFERQCQTMDAAVDSLLEIKGSKRASKASAMKVKASLLKFTGSVVKLGE